MIPTVSGLLVILIGAFLYFKPPIQTLVFGCVCTLFPAAAAIDLPVLGGSSIPPAMLALGFLALRLMRKDVWRSPAVSLGLTRNAWLITFCVYAAITAFLLPRLFAGRINLIPMGRAGLGFVPLRVTAQNTTQAFYMLGTAFASFAATAFATRKNSVNVIVSAFVVHHLGPCGHWGRRSSVLGGAHSGSVRFRSNRLLRAAGPRGRGVPQDRGHDAGAVCIRRPRRNLFFLQLRTLAEADFASKNGSGCDGHARDARALDVIYGLYRFGRLHRRIGPESPGLPKLPIFRPRGRDRRRYRAGPYGRTRGDDP